MGIDLGAAAVILRVRWARFIMERAIDRAEQTRKALQHEEVVRDMKIAEFKYQFDRLMKDNEGDDR